MDNDCIEKQINLRAPIEKVWKALSNSNEFGAWFGMRFDGPFVPGSPVSGTISPTKVNAEVAAAQKPLEGMPVEITIEKNYEIEIQTLLILFCHIILLFYIRIIFYNNKN